MKEDRNEYIGYLPICPFRPEDPEMLIRIPLENEISETNNRSVPETVSEFAANTETWD